MIRNLAVIRVTCQWTEGRSRAISSNGWHCAEPGAISYERRKYFSWCHARLTQPDFETMNHRLVRITLFSALGIVIAVLFAWQYGFLPTGGNRPGISGIAKIGGPFTLTDHTGAVRTEQDFRGKLMLIYFGYTYCPDVCPTALQIMSVALQNLGGKAEAVTPVFITIDPARDTAQHLGDYVKNFHALMVGLTGSAAQIKQTAKVFRVYYRKAEAAAGDPPKDYLMDHSSVVYLMDREGRYITHFTHRSPSEKIEAAIQKYL